MREFPTPGKLDMQKRSHALTETHAPSRRSAWQVFSSLICALGMVLPYLVLSRQTSEFRGAGRGQLLVQAAGPGRAEIGRP